MILIKEMQVVKAAEVQVAVTLALHILYQELLILEAVEAVLDIGEKIITGLVLV